MQHQEQATAAPLAGESQKGKPRRPRPLWQQTLFQRPAGAVRQGAFVRNVCGHTGMVARLKLDARLEGHQGCVNTVAFSLEGDLAVTGR